MRKLNSFDEAPIAAGLATLFFTTAAIYCEANSILPLEAVTGFMAILGVGVTVNELVKRREPQKPTGTETALKPAYNR